MGRDYVNRVEKTARSERDRRTGVALSAAGAGLGTYAGLGSRAAELAYLRHLPAYQVPAVAGLSRGLGWGSGEGRMTGNFVNLANRAGVSSFFVNPSYEGLENAYRISSKELGRRDLAVLATKTLTDSDELIAGVPERVWKRLFDSAQSKGLVSKSEFIRRLRRGQFDGFRFGELTDNITLLGHNAVTGKMKMRPWEGRESLGKYKSVFQGERGMNYSSVDGVLPQNVLNSTELWAGGPRNMAHDVGWVDNYSELTNKLIPASQMDNSVWNRSDLLSRLKHRIDRRRVEKFIKANGGDATGKKIIFLSGGSTGPMAAEKLKLTLAALDQAGMGDVHVLAQVGGGTLHGTSNINPVSSLEFLKSLPKDRVTLTEYVPGRQMRSFYNGADVNLGYGGSSSLSELLGSRTPSVFMRDSALNDENIGFAVRQFGAKGIDSKRYGVARRLLEHMERHPGSSLEDAAKAVRGTLLAQDSAAPMVDEIISRLGSGSSSSHASALRGMLDRESSEFGTTLRRLLDPALRNSKGNASRVKSILRLQRLRNAEVGRAAGNSLRHLSGLNSIPLKFKIPAALAVTGLSGVGLHYATRQKPGAGKTKH